MSYDFYEASLSIYTSAKQSIIDENQEYINQMFEAASDYEIVEEQQTVGKDDYQEIECRLNSVIVAGTTKSFSDDWRKILFKEYNHSKWLGQMYKFSNETWLATNTNTFINGSASSVLRRCNNYLKWYDDNGIYHEIPCVIEREISSENMIEGSKGVPQIYSTLKVMVQRNDETNSLKLNKRFMFDTFSYQLQQINNHISKTYMELYMFETQTQSEDDTINNVANGNLEAPINTTELKILPMVDSICLNDSVTFMVNKYINGVVNNDEFIVVCTGVPMENYKLNIIDGNSFKITNLKETAPLLKIICTDKETNEQVSLSVKLTKEW